MIACISVSPQHCSECCGSCNAQSQNDDSWGHLNHQLDTSSAFCRFVAPFAVRLTTFSRKYFKWCLWHCQREFRYFDRLFLAWTNTNVYL